MPRSGIVPVIGGTGASSPTSYRRFDFVSAPDDEYFETFSQTDPVIGMRAENSLEYAPHAMPNVFSVPSQAFEHTRTFNTSSWITNGAPATQIIHINGRDWKYIEGGGGSSDLAQRITGGRTSRPRDPNALWTFSWRVPKGGSNNVRYVRLAQWETEYFCSAIFDLVDGDLGTVEEPVGTTVVAGFVDYGDEWEIFLTATNPSTLSPYASLHTCVSATDPTRVAGGEILVAEPRSFPGSWRPVDFENTGASAALTNWQVAGTNLTMTTVWDEEEEAFCYELTGLDAGNHWTQPSGRRASVAVPHTMTMRAKLVEGSSYDVGFAVAGPSTTFTNTSWQNIKTTLTPATVPAEFPQIGLPNVAGKVRFYMVDAAEGQETFGLDLIGYERYLIRRKQGIGGLWEPDGIQNKCQVKNVAPMDFTGFNFSGDVQNQKIVQRGELWGNLTQAHWDSVEAADPKGTLQSFCYFERGAGFASCTITGPAGNTNTHNNSIFALGGGTVGLGFTNTARPVIPLTGSLERIEAVQAPPTANDIQTIEPLGDGFWVLFAGSQLTEGAKLRSLIPVGGANRIKSADRLTAPTDSVGVDRSRNSAPNSNTDSAVLGPEAEEGSAPIGWQFAEGNGWLLEYVGKGKTANGSYLDVRFTGTPTGPVYEALTSSQTIVAAQGETWRDTASFSIIAGDLTNVTQLAIDLSERDATGAYLSGTTSLLDVVNVLNDAPRRFSVFRTTTDANIAFILPALTLNASGGPVDFTLRIADWSAQKSSDLLPHVETTSKAIPFKQWEVDEGLTVVMETEDPALDVDFCRFWEMYGTDRLQNHIAVTSGSGAAQTDAFLNVRKDGGDTGTTTGDIQGTRTSQGAMTEADQQFWIDGASIGVPIAASLPTDIDTIMIGDISTGGVNIDGVVRGLSFTGTRKTSGVSDGFGAGFDEGFE